MKKTTTILTGLLLSTLALAGCGNKKSETKAPERGEYTFNVEFEEVYSGRKYKNALNNLYSQLSSDKLIEIDTKSNFYIALSPNQHVEEVNDGKVNLYKNGVLEYINNYNESYCAGSTITPYSNQTKNYAAIVGEQLIGMGDFVTGSEYEHDIDIYDWHEGDDISLYLELADIAYFGGNFGVDKNGNGLYYFNMISENDKPGYTEKGTPCDVYDYQVTETLVTFSGSAETGRPTAIYNYHSQYRFYDDDMFKTEKAIFDEKNEMTFVLKYGNRKDYKNKDSLVEKMATETINDRSSIEVNKYSDCTLSADKKTVTYIPTNYANPYLAKYNFGESYDGKKEAGYAETYYELTMSANDALTIQFLTTTEYAKFDQGTNEYTLENNYYGALATIECDNLPKGIIIVKDEYDNQYLYAESKVFDVSFQIEWELILTKENNNTVIKPKAKVTFTDGEIY